MVREKHLSRFIEVNFVHFISSLYFRYRIHVLAKLNI